MYKKMIEDIYPILSNKLISVLNSINSEVFLKISEIRIRVNKNVILKLFDGDIVLEYIATYEDIVKILEKITNYSIYSMQDDINLGYITIKGGHRIGICGTSVIENEKIQNIKNISSINIRIARQLIGISNNIYDILYKFAFENTLIISAPNCGKTTLLRDLIRNLSNNGNNVCVIDERSEIGATYNGIMQMDLGIRTDLLNRCLKYLGVINVIRSMGPDIIAIDEIGTSRDIDSIKQALYSGVKVIATMHGKDINDIYINNINEIIKLNIFKYLVILKKDIKPGKIDKIYYLNEDKIYSVLDNIKYMRGA